MDTAPEPFLLLEPDAAPRLEAVPSHLADGGAGSLAACRQPLSERRFSARYSDALGSLAGKCTVRPLGRTGLGGPCDPRVSGSA